MNGGTNAKATRTCIGVFHTRHLPTSSSRPALRYPRRPIGKRVSFSSYHHHQFVGPSAR